MKRNFQHIAQEVRRDILTMSYRAKSAHTGGSLSVVEILVALYFSAMRVNPRNACDPRRDRLIYSKAHDAKALYSVLARRGFFSPKLLEQYEMNEGKLLGHSTRNCALGVEISAGSLGHGLPIAAGVAFALKAQKNKTSRAFAILSDGECDEGSTWEAALFAGHHRLDNLVVIIDYNELQGYGFTKDILNLEPFQKKWEAFGFGVKHVNGNDVRALLRVLKKLPFRKGKPSVLIAHTVKGLGGVGKYVGTIASQYKPPTKEEYEEAVGRLTKH
jgi:transketolase